MTSSSFIINTLLQSGNGFLFQTLLADLLCLGAFIYIVFVVNKSLVKPYMAFKNMAKDIGGPKSHWLLGDVPKYGLNHEGLLNSIERCNDFPAMCIYYRSFVGAVHVYHPDVVKTAMARSYPKDFMYQRFLKTVLRNGLVISTGSLWKRNRRLLTPIFHFEILKFYQEIFNKNVLVFLESCNRLSTKERSHEFCEEITNLTFSNMMECIMSQKAEDLSEDYSVYIKSVKEASLLVMNRAITPYLWSDIVYFRTSNGRKLLAAVKTLCDISAKIINERKAQMDCSSKGDENSLETLAVTTDFEDSTKVFKKTRKNMDFLDILLQTKDQNGVGLSDTEIIDEVITFFAAGQETVATALSWTLYNLAVNQTCQRRCREEIHKVLGDKEICEPADLPNLSYLTQCIKESLRTHPPAHVITRCLTEDVVFSHRFNNYKKVTVKKGTSIGVRIYALHHNPHVWKNPEVYDPDRFNEENIQNIPPFAYMPFAAGPRNCIGQSFAMLELKVTLARVLKHYEFYRDPNAPEVTFRVGVTMTPQNLQLRVKKTESF